MAELTPMTLLKEILRTSRDAEVFIAGGPVRDWLLGKPVTDVDLVLSTKAIDAAKHLADVSGGVFVMLDEAFQVARVVVGNFSYDISQYRGGASSIEEDLYHRDFTINAMALRLDEVIDRLFLKAEGLFCKREHMEHLVIDPFNGKNAIKKRIIRAIARQNLLADPLRMLRAFRFMATLNFRIHQETLSWIEQMAGAVVHSAPERIDGELDKIMASQLAGTCLKGLYDSRPLRFIIPETAMMEGVDQPGFHHLDVLGHLFEAVSSMDKLVTDPCLKFENCTPFREWLTENRGRISWLKWAAFMHDFGKPARKGMKENGRVTFYEHDKEGAQMARDVAKRLRWSKEKRRFVALLVRLHMRPFHLLNDLRKSGPSKRAMRRLLDEIGPDYPALFLLAMADSMAGCGPMKPAGLDHEISVLFDKIHSFYLKSLRPMEESPPLLTGNDIMEILGIGPGPRVGHALRAIREAQVEGRIKTKDQAMELVLKEFKSS